MLVCRKAWGSNVPDPRARAGPEAKHSAFQATAAYQSPYAASPGALNTTRRQKTRGVDSTNDQEKSAAAPGPLDDILGQVTDLLSQVNDILGR